MTTDLIPLENPDPGAKRAADEAHRERIHAEIMDDLAYVCGPDALLKVLLAITEGRIRHLTINY